MKYRAEQVGLRIDASATQHIGNSAKHNRNNVQGKNMSNREYRQHAPVQRRSTLKLLAGASALGLIGGIPFVAPADAADWAFAPFREDPFDADWRFVLGDPAGAADRDFNDSSWTKLDLPHDFATDDLTSQYADDTATSGPELWTIPDGPSEIGPFQKVTTDATTESLERDIAWTRRGVGWYRKHFMLDPAGPVERCEIRFDGIYQKADVYLNGFHVGFRAYDYSGFIVDLTKHLTSGVNVIAVRVDASGYTSRWYPGAGIYRHVWLSQTGAVAIPYSGIHITTPIVSRSSAIVEIDVAIRSLRDCGAVTAYVVLFDALGRTVGSANASQSVAADDHKPFRFSIRVQNPLLWSVDTPSLYVAEVALVARGRVVHERSASFGIRSVTIDASGLTLNGMPIKLEGGCVHATNGFLGAAAIDRAEVKKVELMKAAGFNAIRTAHNPPSPEFLDACDRLGMLVYEEAFDTWDQAKTPDDYHLYFAQFGVPDVRKMVIRDRNHPCVIMWSIGNEISDIATTAGVGYGTQLYDAIREVDRTRPITAGGMADGSYPNPIDATGPQWGYLDIGDIHYDNADYPTLHAAHPTKALVSSESFPYDFYNSWKAVLSYPYVIGDFVWSGIDYIGESGLGHTALAPVGSPPLQVIYAPNGDGYSPRTFPYFQSGTGDIDTVGIRKPQSHFRDVVVGRSRLEFFVQRPTPAGQIQQYGRWGWYDELASWTWPGHEGETLVVDVYTSGDRVDLMLDDKVIASQNVAATDNYRSQFSVVYAPGTLSALAYKNGVPIAVRYLQTAGAAHGLRLVPDRDAIAASRNDLSYVVVEVVDAAGRLVPDAVVNVAFSVSGAGELAAVGNGNPHNMGSFKQPHRHTYHGRALAILRPTGSRGAIQLTASSQGLRSATLSVSVS